jgi:glycosyltransferase involved in cell wall biosynthesis
MTKIAISLLMYPNGNIAGIGYFLKSILQSLTHDDLELFDYNIIFFVTGDYNHAEVFSIPDSSRITIKNIKNIDSPIKRIFFELILFPKILCDCDIFYSINLSITKTIKRTKKITTIHDIISFFRGSLNRHSFPLKMYRNLIIRNEVKKANMIVTVSENSKNDLIKMFKIPENRIKIIYNSVTIPVEFNETKNNFRKEKGRYFVYCGNVTKGKNIEGMILAFNKYRELQNDGNVKFYIIGKNYYSNNEIKKMVQCEYGQDVIFTGYLEEFFKQQYIKNSIAMIYCSLYEGFGIPPLEAMNWNIPSIVSNISSLPEVVGKAGLKVDPYDVDAIAKAMIDIQDKQIRNNLISNIKNQLDKFDSRKQVIKLLELFRSI